MNEEWDAPHLKSLMETGVYANGINSVFLSVTYPSHTSIISGAYPSEHGIFYNVSRWTDGSTLLKNEGDYYMMYSANNFAGENYAIGYATASSPLGPFQKSDHNPVLQKEGAVTGTGHNSVIADPDGRGWICVYHGRTEKTGPKRLVFMDKMDIDENGILNVEGPTLTEQQLVSKENLQSE
ncbi:MAG: family 43 glycosylhydrolase [Christiangramia sp.]|nr:family 43 glycosylhydrolase [Christiangramia sp.]